MKRLAVNFDGGPFTIQSPACPQRRFQKIFEEGPPIITPPDVFRQPRDPWAHSVVLTMAFTATGFRRCFGKI